MHCLATAAILATTIATLAVPAAAQAVVLFENVANGARAERHLDELAWSLTATCAAGDPVEQRQCRQLRDARARSYDGTTLLVEADPRALTIGPYDKAKKSVSLQLASCVACTPIAVDGAAWRITGATPTLAYGKLTSPLLYDNARIVADEADAKAWLASLGAWRVQMVIRLAATRTWQVDAARGVLVDIVGWRVIAPCSGEVVIASPASAAVAPDLKACPASKRPATSR